MQTKTGKDWSTETLGFAPWKIWDEKLRLVAEEFAWQKLRQMNYSIELWLGTQKIKPWHGMATQHAALAWNETPLATELWLETHGILA